MFLAMFAIRMCEVSIYIHAVEDSFPTFFLMDVIR